MKLIENLNDSWKDINQYHPNLGDEILGLYRNGSVKRIVYDLRPTSCDWINWIFDNGCGFFLNNPERRGANTPKLWKYDKDYTPYSNPQKLRVK
jgi:hypothetical protein